MAHEQDEVVVVLVQCSSCGGTGVYHGLFEPEGVGVRCIDCNHSGGREIRYYPYTGQRKIRDDIAIVRESAGKYVLGTVGPTGPEVTYEDFLKEVPEVTVTS